MLHLDHIFVFVEPDAPEKKRLDEAGLVESYRRDHRGQGTSNVCYCFDNAYLELLWVRDAEELSSKNVAPTRLAERADRHQVGTSPFGIALRSEPVDAPLPFPTWKYDAPFLPDGVQIDVAQDSRDPTQPFIFRAPGGTRPDSWSDGRAGARQMRTGLAEIMAVKLGYAPPNEPGEAIRNLEATGLLSVSTRSGGPGLRLGLGNSDVPARWLDLPELGFQP